MTSPDQRDDIAHLDWTLSCKHCDQPAVWLAEEHVVGVCRHPALNDAGNIERYLCDSHMKRLTKDAKKQVSKLYRRPWILGLFYKEPPRCSSCGVKVMHVGDIIQIAVKL